MKRYKLTPEHTHTNTEYIVIYLSVECVRVICIRKTNK